MESTKATVDKAKPSERRFSLRRAMRAASLVGLVSAVPGFWPAAIVLPVALLAMLLPGLAVLAGLIALQLPVYFAWKRLMPGQVKPAHVKAAQVMRVQARAVQTRQLPAPEDFFQVRPISR